MMLSRSASGSIHPTSGIITTEHGSLRRRSSWPWRSLRWPVETDSSPIRDCDIAVAIRAGITNSARPVDSATNTTAARGVR